MAWDSTRPVPWRRLVTEWLIYATLMAAIVVIFMRDRPMLGIIAGLAVSGPLYLALGAVLAKFGYSRKTLREGRAAAEARNAAAPAATAGSSAPRGRPAPTKRTGGTPARGRRR